jgi:phosphate transport system permease protein
MKARRIDQLVALFSHLCALILLLLMVTLVGYLLYRGHRTIDRELFFGWTDPWQALTFQRQVFDGLFPALVGTTLLVGLAILIAAPIGLAAGIYLAEYARGTTRTVLNLLFDLLSAIPSIVIGLFGLAVAIVLHRWFPGRFGPCLLLSALCLALLVLPYLIRATQNALESIDPQIRQSGRSMGASKLQNLFYILLPHRLPELTSGLILAIGRCAEDTAVIMLTGVVATAGVPHSILQNYEAIPFYIYTVASQYTDASELNRGFSAALILITLCCGLFLLAFFIQHHLQRRLLFRQEKP